MKLDDVKTWFDQNGLPFDWLVEDQPPQRLFQKLRPPAGTLIDIAPIEAAFVIPDVHLGWGADVFTYNGPNSAFERRLEAFLDKLAAFRNFLQGKVDVVQVGDWYDFWRAPGIGHAQAKQLIEAQYPGIVSRARDLGVRHCIGNHDAAFADPAIRSGLDVEIVRSIGAGHGVICFHGHDTKTLESILVDADATQLLLNIFNVFNTVVPVVGAIGSIVQRAADGSSQEPWSLTDKTSKPWPKAKVPGPPTWAAPWVDRIDAAQIGIVLSGLELCTNQDVQVAIMGHSHRPGISWCSVAGRQVPVIDAGSWTYGRAEFAIVCPDGIGVARLK